MAIPLPAIDLAQLDKSPLGSLHFAKAMSCYYAGNTDEALMQLMRTVDLDPDYTEVYYWSGLCYAKSDEPVHAVIDLERYLKEQPKGRYAETAAKALAVAKTKEAAAPLPRLGPDLPTKAAPGKAPPTQTAPTTSAR
jgi:hypothetical protein